jgi:hypothetical protein
MIRAAAVARFSLLIRPEQGKNREKNFFRRVFGHFVGNIVFIYQYLERYFRCYSITGKPICGTGKGGGDNSENSAHNSETRFASASESAFRI